MKRVYSTRSRSTVHPEVVGNGARRLRAFTPLQLKHATPASDVGAFFPSRRRSGLKPAEARAPTNTNNMGMHGPPNSLSQYWEQTLEMGLDI